MGKRSASGSHASLLQKLRAAIGVGFNPMSRFTAGRGHSGQAHPVQSLERRVLFSSGTLVSLEWEGATVQAYQNQYIAETSHLAAFDRLAQSKGFTDVTSLGGEGYYSFDSTLPLATMAKLAARSTSAFKVLAPNIVTHIATTTTDDTYLVNQWGLSNTGQLESFDYNGDGVVSPYNLQDMGTAPTTTDVPSPPYPNENQYGTVGDDLDVQQAWDVTTGSKSVVVAVLDTGIDLTHPDLTSNIWTNPLDTTANGDDGDGFPNDVNGWNFVDNDSVVQDDNGHGTEVSGIIGAQGNDGLGISGVNWNVSLLPVKIADASGDIATANEIAGLNYCITLKDDGINIVAINESFTQDVFPLNVLTSDAVAQAGKAGILDVVAAGNSSLNLDSDFTTNSKNSLLGTNVITVAAVDNQFKLANFSNFGASSVDLAAPGVRIFSTELGGSYGYADGDGTGNTADTDGGPGFSSVLSGTSFSAPFVTGIIALEAAANPSASPPN